MKSSPIMQSSMILLIFFIIMLIAACSSNYNSQTICYPPKIQVGSDCCFDINNNSICDRDEKAPEEEKLTGEVVKEIQKPICTDECSSGECVGMKFIACEEKSDGCKDKVNKGYVKDKCGVECLMDSYCASNEACVEYKCVVRETDYGINQNVVVDDLIYKVTKAETFTEMGIYIFDKKTNGKFIKVYIEVTNTAKKTQQILTPRFTIIDNQDREYERLSDDMFYISDYIEFGKQLQPSLTASGAVVFEMPKDAERLKLVIRGDWQSTSEVKVALSNIVNMGRDRTKEMEQDAVMDKAMEEGQKQMEEIMSKCNAPFKCFSDCAPLSDVGQKDCPSGQVCCMQSQEEYDRKMKELQEETDKYVQEMMNKCNSPFVCSSSCPQYMDVGQKDCGSGQVCCMQT